MLTRDTLFVFLFAIPIYQLLYYTVQLVTFRKRNPSRRYFGLLLLTMTLVLVINTIHHLGYAGWMRILYVGFTPLLLTLVPVYFFYLVSLANENSKRKTLSSLTLFVPPILLLIVNVFTYGLLNRPTQLMFISGHFLPVGITGQMVQVVSWIFRYGLPLLLVIQLIMAFIQIRSLKRAEEEAMKKDPGYLAWLQPVWIDVISVSLVVFILGIVIQNLLFGMQDLLAGIIFNVLLLASGGLAGYFGMKQDALLLQVATVGKSATAPRSLRERFLQNETGQIQKTFPASPPLIPLQEAERIMGQLDALMQAKKPFMDARYSLDELCSQLDVPRKSISYVLNEVMEKNFYGFINELRVQEAIKLMEHEGQRFTIEAIARQVGFNSKSSFYACFRKYTGVTPTEYMTDN